MWLLPQNSIWLLTLFHVCSKPIWLIVWFWMWRLHCIHITNICSFYSHLKHGPQMHLKKIKKQMSFIYFSHTKNKWDLSNVRQHLFQSTFVLKCFVIILFTNRNVFIHWFRAKNKNLKSASPFRLNIVTWLLRQTIPVYFNQTCDDTHTVSWHIFCLVQNTVASWHWFGLHRNNDTMDPSLCCRFPAPTAHWMHLFDVNYVFTVNFRSLHLGKSHKSYPLPLICSPFFFFLNIFYFTSLILRFSNAAAVFYSFSNVKCKHKACQVQLCHYFKGSGDWSAVCRPSNNIVSHMFPLSGDVLPIYSSSDRTVCCCFFGCSLIFAVSCTSWSLLDT